MSLQFQNQVFLLYSPSSSLSVYSKGQINGKPIRNPVVYGIVLLGNTT